MNPRMNKVMKILTAVVIVIILFIVIFTIGKTAGLFKFGPTLKNEKTKDDEVKVPNVVGKTEDEAKKALNEVGLGFKVDERKESKQYEAGTVSEQKTEAGKKVKKNTTVHVVVSSALVGDKIKVPDVSGMSEDDARSRLQQEGFKKIATPQYEYSDSVAEGDVIGTTPAANAEATEDTEIVMRVSKGTEKKTVPNLIGMMDADAQSAILAEGLVVGSVGYEYNDDVPEGQVYAQSVDGGKKVAPGTAVGISVSNGPKPAEKVEVPPVTDTSLENARQLLSSAGLSVGNVSYQYSDSVTAGNVISCSPGVGNSVEEGTSVSLVVSQGPKGSDSGTDPEEPEDPPQTIDPGIFGF